MTFTAARTYGKFPEARTYRDFRVMMEKEGDRIDAVYCGTPDHTHAIIVLPALKAGKHVCCVKAADADDPRGASAGKSSRRGGRGYAGHGLAEYLGRSVSAMRDDLGRGNRGCPGDARLVEPPAVAAGHAPPKGTGAGTRYPRLGPVDRSVSNAAIRG